MADDKNKRWQDGKLVAAEQPYEVAYFAKRHGITTTIARTIIERFGPSREACDRRAEIYKASLNDVLEGYEDKLEELPKAEDQE